MRTPIVLLAGPGRDRRPEGQHPGLLLQRYLSISADDKNKKRYPEERRSLLDAAIQSAKSEPLHRIYKLAFDRWSRCLNGMVLARADRLKTDGRLIVGLGADNVLETGIRLHHTYGLPFLPGSALKGLASHYCDQVWGQSEEGRGFQKNAAHHKFLFGATDDGGAIVFHDAWIVPASVNEGCLALDVMTPHHPDWQLHKKSPTDFDSPVPVPFLSVAGTFHVAVSWAGPAAHAEARRWTNLAFDLLTRALSDWGAGGKTSGGYGRLGPVVGLPVHTLNRATTVVSAKDVQRRPKYERGQRVTVTRIADPKGKVKFQADDDFIGHFANEAAPAVDVGETTEVWVANVSPQGYTFTGNAPKVSKKVKK